jgi:hypothetical protein
MFQIPLTVSNFPAVSGVKNGFRSLKLSWSQLEWAAISVGKKSLRHIHYHGTFSKHEIAYRTAIIYANLTLDKAKAQAKQVTSIGGAMPILRLGCVASFNQGHLHLVADDPPADESESRKIDLPVTTEEFMFDYYAPFRAMLESHDTPQGERAQVVTLKNQRIEALRFEPLDLIVGLVESQTGRHTDVNHLRPARPASENSFLGADGIFIELGSSWSEEMMALEPQLRSRLS